MNEGTGAVGFSLADLPTELSVLLLAVILGLVHVFAAAIAMTKDRGAQWNAGPRDGEPPAMGNLAGRLDRASNNFKETFPFFAAAVLIAFTTGRLSELSALGAQLYLVGRIIYLPLYAFGIPMVRSLAFMLSIAGMVMVLIAAFTPA